MNCTIHISDLDMARAFVATTAKYPDIKIMLNCEEYSVDAHSIIGILSLDLSQPLTLCAEGGNLNGLIADLEPYTV